jgi:hypothetical protein
VASETGCALIVSTPPETLNGLSPSGALAVPWNEELT